MWGNREKSFSHFLDISRGSLFEIETQLLIANGLGCIKNKPLFKEVLGQFEEDSKMLNAFMKMFKN
ncbi:MAG: four helix bundle protein [Flavobacterium sp.]|uniref:four helix bundle protein n=1 Tax=Flavobacterium frigidarium TaxID=99286 RepID=UPI0030DC53C2|nr:four helix bundle protein [Flavobacterium sp.]